MVFAAPGSSTAWHVHGGDGPDRGRRSGAWPTQRLALLAGPAAAVVLTGGRLLAAYVFTSTASFDWTGDPDQFRLPRHASIAPGCLLGLVFPWSVWTGPTNPVRRVGLGLFALGLAYVGDVGVLFAGYQLVSSVGRSCSAPSGPSRRTWPSDRRR